MSVEYEHPLYVKRKRQWDTLRDCIEGEDAIKDAGIKYLPMASGSTPQQYNAFKTRARWINYTGRTLDGLHGLIFRRDPVVECSDEFKNTGILENIDRRGTSLYQFLSDSTYDSMITTFGGFLVDMPATSGAMNKLQMEELGIRPYIRYYPAESIVNWRYGIINGIEQLCMVVLKEESDIPMNDEFSHEINKQYRVLDIENGVYRQRLFSPSGKDANGDTVYSEEVIPITINNKEVTEIPFVMLPSKFPEKPMLLDLAYCNIGHYQKSADYENGVHLTTIPTGYVTGHKSLTDERGEPETIHLGHDAFLQFEEEAAKVGTLVFSGAGLTHSETALNQALSDMAILGTRLVTPERGTTESADSAKIHRAGENALLATYAKNMSEKITKALRIVEEWIGIEPSISVNLCTDYDTLAFDPNALNALANLAEAGKLPMPYVYWNLRNGEYAPPNSTYEEYSLLLQMEQSEMTPLEIIQQYRAIQQGKKVSIPDNVIKHKPIEEEEV